MVTRIKKLILSNIPITIFFGICLLQGWFVLPVIAEGLVANGTTLRIPLDQVRGFGVITAIIFTVIAKVILLEGKND